MQTGRISAVPVHQVLDRIKKVPPSHRIYTQASGNEKLWWLKQREKYVHSSRYVLFLFFGIVVCEAFGYCLI